VFEWLPLSDFPRKSWRRLQERIATVWLGYQRLSHVGSKASNLGALKVTDLVAGEYTIVVSAFEPQHMGPFTLKVESSHPFDMQPIHQEGAGMYSRVIQGSWSVTSRDRFSKSDNQKLAGTASQRLVPRRSVDTQRIRFVSFKFHQVPNWSRCYPTSCLCQVDPPSRIRLQLLQPSPAVALNVTVFAKMGSEGESLAQKSVLTSGAYDDTVAGVATPQITLGAGTFYVVPSTYSPGHEAGYKLIVYSSVSGVTVSPI